MDELITKADLLSMPESPAKLIPESLLTFLHDAWPETEPDLLLIACRDISELTGALSAWSQAIDGYMQTEEDWFWRIEGKSVKGGPLPGRRLAELEVMGLFGKLPADIVFYSQPKPEVCGFPIVGNRLLESVVPLKYAGAESVSAIPPTPAPPEISQDICVHCNKLGADMQGGCNQFLHNQCYPDHMDGCKVCWNAA